MAFIRYVYHSFLLHVKPLDLTLDHFSPQQSAIIFFLLLYTYDTTTSRSDGYNVYQYEFATVSNILHTSVSWIGSVDDSSVVDNGYVRCYGGNLLQRLEHRRLD